MKTILNTFNNQHSTNCSKFEYSNCQSFDDKDYETMDLSEYTSKSILDDGSVLFIFKKVNEDVKQRVEEFLQSRITEELNELIIGGPQMPKGWRDIYIKE